MWSLTTMPRFTVSAALRPSSTLGRMPAAMTTISAAHLFAIGEGHALHMPVAQQALGLARGEHAHAHLLHLAGEIGAARCIELHVHERVHQVDHGDVAALQLKAAGGFEPQQSAADDDGADALSGGVYEAAGVVEIAEGEDVFLVDAVDRRNPGGGSGGEQELVVMGGAAVVAFDGAALRVDVDDSHAEA